MMSVQVREGGDRSKVRFFYDCEFIEDGLTIDLVSIGVADEDGREFYAVSTEFAPERAGRWVRTNVLPKLPPPADRVWPVSYTHLTLPTNREV